MPVPTISATQSILGYQQWEYFEFQPFATHLPTEWSINNPLPAGLALDAPALLAITSTANVIACTGTFSNGDQVLLFSLTGGSGVVANTIYYARDVVASTSLKLAATAGGAALTFTNITAGFLSAKPKGRISGAAQVPGVWVFGLTANNADGASAVQQFTIGIEPGALVPDSLPWISVDLVSGGISVDGVAVPLLDAAARGKINKGEEPPYAILVKEGDDLLSRITFNRQGTPQDISLTALKMVLKQYEPESAVTVSTEAFAKQGTGSGANFLLHSKFEGLALGSALSGYEDDAGTVFFALAEIEYTQVNPETVGPATLVRSSATFAIRVERDIANNA